MGARWPAARLGRRRRRPLWGRTSRGPRVYTRQESAGFTMVETTIVIAIFALAATVIVPAFGNVTMAELRTSASKLSGAIRSTYDTACLTGQTHRMVLDLGSKAIKVAATEQVLNFEPGSNVLAEASKVNQNINEIAALAEEVAKNLEPLGGVDAPVPALGALFGVNKLAGAGVDSQEAFTADELALELSPSVRILDVWIQGMDEPVRTGQAYLYFFPHGYTQDALIHLEDEDGRVFTVKVSALTGRTRIENGYVEPPK